jgi:hypothetical protein
MFYAIRQVYLSYLPLEEFGININTTLKKVKQEKSAVFTKK